jgi:hypothetical protein
MDVNFNCDEDDLLGPKKTIIIKKNGEPTTSEETSMILDQLLQTQEESPEMVRKMINKKIKREHKKMLGDIERIQIEASENRARIEKEERDNKIFKIAVIGILIAVLVALARLI